MQAMQDIDKVMSRIQNIQGISSFISLCLFLAIKFNKILRIRVLREILII